MNGVGDSVLGTMEGVSNSNRVGEKGIRKKGQDFHRLTMKQKVLLKAPIMTL